MNKAKIEDKLGNSKISYKEEKDRKLEIEAKLIVYSNKEDNKEINLYNIPIKKVIPN